MKTTVRRICIHKWDDDPIVIEVERDTIKGIVIRNYYPKCLFAYDRLTNLTYHEGYNTKAHVYPTHLHVFIRPLSR